MIVVLKAYIFISLNANNIFFPWQFIGFLKQIHKESIDVWFER